MCIQVSWSQGHTSQPGCHKTDGSSLCYKITHCWLSMLNRAEPATVLEDLLRNSEKPPSTRTHLLWTLQAWVGNLLWFPIPTDQSVALITPSKSPVTQCRPPWDAICIESSAVLLRTKQPSLWLNDFVVLEFLKFPLFLKAFFEPFSLLWTVVGS